MQTKNFVFKQISPELLKETIEREAFFSATFLEHLKALDRLSLCSIQKKIIFHGKELDLGRQKKIFSLFYYLFHNKINGLSRDALIKMIYCPNKESVSERQMACYNHNMVKLISRARKIAKENFSDANFFIDWFPHIAQSKKWLLYRPSVVNIKQILSREISQQMQQTNF